jgi:hypothetical protein
MPLLKGKSKAIISRNISEFHTGKTYAHTAAKFGKADANSQAIAAALSTARRSGKKYAAGGDVSSEGEDVPGVGYIPPATSQDLQAVTQAVTQAVKPFVDMAAAPGRTLANSGPSTPGQWSDEDEAKAQLNAGAAPIWGANTTATLAGVGAPAAEEGAAGIFGGLASKTADLRALNQANHMEMAGKYGDHIWDKTGWARGAEGKWRNEIDDSNAVLNPDLLKPDSKAGLSISIPDSGMRLGDVLQHPDLYDAYPELADMRVKPLEGTKEFQQDPLIKGMYGDEAHGESEPTFYLRSDSPDGVKSTLLHEIQHRVQRIENFPRGSAPNEFLPDSHFQIQARLEKAQPLVDKALEQVGFTDPDDRFRALDAIRVATSNDPEDAAILKRYGHLIMPYVEKIKNDNPKLIDSLGQYLQAKTTLRNNEIAAYDKYKTVMGEVEARNVQTRMKMNPAERSFVPPEFSEDVPRSKQKLPFYADGGPVDYSNYANFRRSSNVQDDRTQTSYLGALPSAVGDAAGDVVGRVQSKIAHPFGQPTPPPTTDNPIAAGLGYNTVTDPGNMKFKELPEQFRDGGAMMRAKRGYATGGGSLQTPWYERTAARDIYHAGLINSPVPGRTDKINMKVKAGSYVVPADIVSGMGQGNTLAGSKKISGMFGSANPLTVAGHFHPRPLKTPGISPGLARGGDAPGVPIVAAGGEHVITPEQLISKYGSLDKGHEIWDKKVVADRKRHRRQLANLPGPKQ